MTTNFGRNVAFSPRRRYVPRDEAEVLAILERHARGKVRVVGSRHSWSDAIVTDDALIDLRHFRQVTVERGAGGNVWATIGGGCMLQRALDQLREHGVTMPAIGLIARQTIAGAISTATHGSGRSSLSHYIAEVRVAAYDADGRARIFVWSGGPELCAARCALGCMGVILSVKLRCVPCYEIKESVDAHQSLDDVLAQETEHPLQQFYLLPHVWMYYAQKRRALPPGPSRRTWYAGLYRLYWLLFIDLGLHIIIKLLAAWMGSRRLIHLFYRRVLPWLLWKPHDLVERSDVALLMKHELFRHLEIEIFVPASAVRPAAHFVRQALTVFDGGEFDPAGATELKRHGLLGDLLDQRGVLTFHYPVTFRRVLPDDTLISPTADAAEPWYAISFITYVEPRDAFFRLASFLARSMTALFGARLHWGKYMPPEHISTDAYPHLAEFRRICRRTDPHGVFRNGFVKRVLGFGAMESPIVRATSREHA